MAGLYLHIPFCRGKCSYCDFYSEGHSISLAPHLIQSIQAEMELVAEGAKLPTSFRTLYFGGGTPSLLSPEAIGSLLESADRLFSLEEDAEISMEINPESVEKESLFKLFGAGINRASIGIQSLNRNDLQFLKRKHSLRESRNAVAWAKNAGFGNISIDLIFGIPGQTALSWCETLTEAVLLEPQHISAYQLTIHPGTPLGQAVNAGEVQPPGEDTVADMFLLAHDMLTAAGFEHYEVSNYALAGYRCRHNEGYWHSEPYLGFGPAAHTFTGKERSWNVPDVHRYIETLSRGKRPVAGRETLKPDQKRLERLSLGLRTCDGIAFRNLNGNAKKAEWIFKEGLAQIQNGRLFLSPRGFLLADEIALYLA